MQEETIRIFIDIAQLPLKALFGRLPEVKKESASAPKEQDGD